MRSSRAVLVGALVVAIVLWLAAPLLAYYPSFVYSRIDRACQLPDRNDPPLPASKASGPEGTCASFIGTQGQSGDIYGVTTSLFSGLALFAVAFTLYSDLAYRRRERRPLVVCNLSSTNFLSFDKPTIDAAPKSFYLRGPIVVSSIAETAINVAILPTLVVGGVEFGLAAAYVDVPVESGKQYPVDLSDLLSRESIDRLCANPQQLPPTQIRFKTSCQNLEGETFTSEVSYNIALRFPDNLNRVMSMRHSGAAFDGSWSDRAAIPLECTLAPNSWKF